MSEVRDRYYEVFHAKKKGDVNYLNIPCDPTIYYADFVANETKFYTEEEHEKVRHLQYTVADRVKPYTIGLQNTLALSSSWLLTTKEGTTKLTEQNQTKVRHLGLKSTYSDTR